MGHLTNICESRAAWLIVFDPRGIRQMDAPHPLDLLLAGINTISTLSGPVPIYTYETGSSPRGSCPLHPGRYRHKPQEAASAEQMPR